MSAENVLVFPIWPKEYIFSIVKESAWYSSVRSSSEILYIYITHSSIYEKHIIRISSKLKVYIDTQL